MPTIPEKLPHVPLALYPALRAIPSERLAVVCQCMVIPSAGAQVFKESRNCL